MMVMKRFAFAARSLVLFLAVFLCELAPAKTYVKLNEPTAQEQAQLLVKHIHVMGGLKALFAKKRLEKAPKVTTKKTKQKTQSEAHLSVSQKSVDARWSSEKKHLKNVIDKVMACEREHNDDYYVFYHAQMREFCVLHDFLKEFYQFFNMSKPFDDFAFLRVWSDGVSDTSTASLQDFIDNYEKGELHRYRSEDCCRSGDRYRLGHPSWDDGEDYLRRSLLSVNLSLFGNTSKIGYGECTFDFFMRSDNANYCDMRSTFGMILEKCGINASYANRLLELASSLKSSEGALMQIFIPKSYVDRCVYLSHDYGTPYRIPIVDSSFNAEKGRHMNISSVLELYKDSPEKIAYIDQLQARILFYPDGMLDPNSGIKIIRYTTVPEGAMASYEQKVKVFAEELFTEMLAQKLIIKGSSGTVKAYEGTVLDKLIKIVGH
jgi:hypothetical protein